MSLGIRPEDIHAVLIAGQWFGVAPGTFRVDAFEFVDEFRDQGPLWGGGVGFSFQSPSDERAWISGPMTAIVAVET